MTTSISSASLDTGAHGEASVFCEPILTPRLGAVIFLLSLLAAESPVATNAAPKK